MADPMDANVVVFLNTDSMTRHNLEARLNQVELDFWKEEHAKLSRWFSFVYEAHSKNKTVGITFGGDTKIFAPVPEKTDD